MTMQAMTAKTFSAMPPITMEATSEAHPLKSVLITVFTLKIVVAAFLLATVSLAPPVTASERYMTVAAAD